jgi:hypothetical protein
MRSLAGFFVASVFSISCVASELITFSPGPIDGIRIHTARGDFIAVQQGNSVWVGTLEEYEKNSVATKINDMGGREVPQYGNKPNEHTIVNRRDLRVKLGSSQLNGIYTSIIFGVGADPKLHRPKKKNGEEYVAVNWIQSQKTNVNLTLLDKSIAVNYQPYHCTREPGFVNCEYLIKRESLTTPAALIFTQGTQNPAVIFLESIAKAHYRATVNALGFGSRKLEPSADQLSDLKELHRLDETIPETYQ